MSARLDIPLAEPLVQQPAVARAWRGAAMLVLAAIAAAALAALAVAAWLHATRPAIVPGPVGQWYAVQVQNGQMFYGVLREAGPRQLQLGDVYYVQPFTQPDGRQGNRVVSRERNDWHGPTSLTIPVDRIVSVETVGGESQLARLIAQDQGRAAK
ncbi:hypothetical protein [Pseudoduganella lutea]|uniref:Uncharacterized protein n=1 Tax=Pseudoduganella lutea TaxID=321985 RepID=A0A4P6L007_9BURK|nr:hypothetical protein [Pseudoduganella lutea]QBE64524.1 hypothetical protein EWM63_17280 [Pseudoduganella lutea]